MTDIKARDNFALRLFITSPPPPPYPDNLLHGREEPKYKVKLGRDSHTAYRRPLRGEPAVSAVIKQRVSYEIQLAATLNHSSTFLS